MGAKKGRPKPLGSGRQLKQPPEGAAVTIRAMAADGFSIVGIAAKFKTSKDTFGRWLDESEELREAFEQGREKERHALHNMLYKQAMEKGNSTAAMFLLKARHGYREGDQGDTGNRVSITFALPGALPMQEFINLSKVVKDEPSNSVKQTPTKNIIHT
jgi:hypothetical protein